MASNRGKGSVKENGSGDATVKKAKVASKNPEQLKKIELLREIDTLEKRVNALEREKGTHLYNKRSDFRKDFSTLQELENKWLGERKSEKNKVKQNLEKMRHQVDRFQYELQNMKPTPEFVEKLKENMETIEAALNEFKEHQRKIYEELMKEERRLFQEISELEKRFEQWAQAPPIVIPDTKPAKPTKAGNSKRSIIADLPPEVAAFERFLQQTGGHQGGWDQYDHGTFIRIRNKHKAKASFMDEAANSLPGRSITHVTNHEAWYQEYITLLEKKKEAIQKWRLVKEAQKEEVLSKVDENDKEDTEKAEKRAAEKARKIEEERRERQARLSAWKVQKELEKAQEEERKMLEEQRRIMAFEKEKRRQEEIRAKVQEYIDQRKEEEEFLSHEAEARLQAENAEKRNSSRQDVQRFRERDRRKQEELMEKEKSKQEAERERMRKLEKLKEQVEVKVKRDPTRLYKLTEGWKERNKADRQASNAPLISMPHRAVPSWRAGLS